jgi:dynein assembly factor 5
MTNENAVFNDPNSYTLRFNKFLQGIKDDNKAKRKLVMINLEKDVRDLIETSSIDDDLLRFLLKSVLPVLVDSMEKCRDVAVDIIQLLYSKCNINDDLISIVIMNLKNRLGQKEIIETSEELRLKFYELVFEIIEKSSKALLNMHLDDLVPVLINSFMDNYAEVKKKGCQCSRLLSKKLNTMFHKQSESLIKPLLLNITHQHSRVRKDIVECIGDVILYGNNKSVDDVLIHMSQRLFDQAYQVRLSVVQVVGMWLLDLMDRYSYFYKLMPLLLTGFIDETEEIQSTAEALWWDVGTNSLLCNDYLNRFLHFRYFLRHKI